MTRIIRLTFLITALCAFAVMAKAQSSPALPYEGAVHTYVVNGLAPGTQYAFYMASAPHGSSVLNDGSVVEFDFLGETTGTVSPGESTAALSVLWNEGAAAHLFYLGIDVTHPDGCSVSRYLRIVPQVNRFDLLSENLPVDNTESCPAIGATDGFNPLATEYSAGTTTLQFKVRREGSNRGWSFEPVISIDPSWNLDVDVVSVVAPVTGTLIADASNIYNVPATDSEVIVNVAVRNYEGTEQVVTLTIRNQEEEHTRLNDSNAENDRVEHRIMVMPVIMELEEI
ncbi:MAG: hypothetical protein K9H26_01065 [Prolixibacteraceae bacterium]|nr:hypothetical protein [Prolixibacteraceae bacterium]